MEFFESTSRKMPMAFKIHMADNVATLLSHVEPGDILVQGAGSNEVLQSAESIELGHKVALVDIPSGEKVMKYGVVIGLAFQKISAGAWVHLHNCQSQLDERSGTLDLHTGHPGDTKYE
jgi:hypothetical protein